LVTDCLNDGPGRSSLLVQVWDASNSRAVQVESLFVAETPDGQPILVHSDQAGQRTTLNDGQPFASLEAAITSARTASAQLIARAEALATNRPA
jgi:hypothetical protein